MQAPYSALATWILISTLGAQSKAAVVEIPVSGTVQSFSEDFDPASYTLVNGIWEGPTFSYTDICLSGTEPKLCAYDGNGTHTGDLIHQGGTNFLSANYLYQTWATSAFGTGGTMTRLLKFRIAGRDPNLSYRLVTTQHYSLKTPDKFSRFLRGTVATAKIECADASANFNATPSQFKEDLFTSKWFQGALTTYAHVGPGVCPGNEFLVKFIAHSVQDMSFGAQEVTILEESSL